MTKKFSVQTFKKGLAGVLALSLLLVSQTPLSQAASPKICSKLWIENPDYQAGLFLQAPPSFNAEYVESPFPLWAQDDELDIFFGDLPGYSEEPQGEEFTFKVTYFTGTAPLDLVIVWDDPSGTQNFNYFRVSPTKNMVKVTRKGTLYSAGEDWIKMPAGSHIAMAGFYAYPGFPSSSYSGPATVTVSLKTIVLEKVCREAFPRLRKMP